MLYPYREFRAGFKLYPLRLPPLETAVAIFKPFENEIDAAHFAFHFPVLGVINE